MPKKLFVAVASLTLAISGCGGGGHATISVAAPPPPQTSQSLANQPPDSAGLGCLLTDGSVMFQGNRLFDWFKLTPDNSGSYLKGTWSQLANLPAGLGISALPGRGGSTFGADYKSVHRPRFLCQDPRSQHHGGSPEAQSFRQSSMFLREWRPEQVPSKSSPTE